MSEEGQDEVSSLGPTVTLTCTGRLLTALRSPKHARPFLGSACPNAIKDGKALFPCVLLCIKPQGGLACRPPFDSQSEDWGAVRCQT